MGRVLPILFNTDMVRAILDGRKTVTRRIVKHNVDAVLDSPYHKEHPEVPDKQIIQKLCFPPYQPGDILYVREAYCPNYFDISLAGYRGNGLQGNRNAYKADYRKDIVGDVVPEPKWKPSIHMPKEAARIWLKVTDVRVGRLQEINSAHVKAEGIDTHYLPSELKNQFNKFASIDDCEEKRKEFAELWNSTIKKADLDIYGWDANPWVWVIEFERCEKTEQNQP